MYGFVVRRAATIALGLVCGAALAGCGRDQGGTPALGSATQSAARVEPFVGQSGHSPAFWTSVSTAISGFQYPPGYAVVGGSDGNMWVANSENDGGGLLRVSMSGKLTLVPMQYPCGGGTMCTFVVGEGMAVGSDGKFYLGKQNTGSTNSTYVVGVATTSGALTTYEIPSGDFVFNGGYTLGPDKKVWFAEYQHIANIDTKGKITEYAYPSGTNNEGGVTTGPDGNVWFAEDGNTTTYIGKIVPRTGKITLYDLQTTHPSCSSVYGIVAGPDGNLYFNCNGVLGQITTAGKIQTFADATDLGEYVDGLIVGPDGNPWFTDGSSIGEFDPKTDSFTNYVLPSGYQTPQTLALGPDGNVWSVTTNDLDVFIEHPLSVSPASVTLSSIGATATLVVTESGTSAWTATSAKPSICSVKQSAPADAFAVTAVAAGTTYVSIADAAGNSFLVKCTVK